MITGDNLLTAISVARDCQMVSMSDQVLIVEATFDEDNEQQPASIKLIKTEDSENVAINQTFHDDIHQVESGVVQNLPKNYHFAMSGKTWAVLRWFDVVKVFWFFDLFQE